MTTINWLHLSDLHISAENTFDQGVIHEAFYDDLVEQLVENNIKLDFIFFTGDVAYSASSRDYELAVNFLNKLCQTLKFDKGNLFIVPGNHDVNRYKVSKLLDDSRKELETREDIRKIFTNDEMLEKYLMRFDNYSKFISDLYSIKYEMNPSNYYSATVRTIDGIEIGIIGLNSVWASYGGRNDSNNIYISEIQLSQALEKVRASSLRIVLIHHPISWLYEEDKTDIENMLRIHCQIILHGHLHRSDFQIINSIKGQQIIIPAGAIYTGRRISNSYNITSLNFTTKKIRIMPRRYFDGPRKFLRDIETLGDDKSTYFEMDIPQKLISSVLNTK